MCGWRKDKEVGHEVVDLMEGDLCLHSPDFDKAFMSADLLSMWRARTKKQGVSGPSRMVIWSIGLTNFTLFTQLLFDRVSHGAGMLAQARR